VALTEFENLPFQAGYTLTASMFYISVILQPPLLSMVLDATLLALSPFTSTPIMAVNQQIPRVQQPTPQTQTSTLLTRRVARLRASRRHGEMLDFSGVVDSCSILM
jgi:hypothetical protein